MRLLLITMMWLTLPPTLLTLEGEIDWVKENQLVIVYTPRPLLRSSLPEQQETFYTDLQDSKNSWLLRGGVPSNDFSSLARMLLVTQMKSPYHSADRQPYLPQVAQRIFMTPSAAGGNGKGNGGGLDNNPNLSNPVPEPGALLTPLAAIVIILYNLWKSRRKRPSQ